MPERETILAEPWAAQSLLDHRADSVALWAFPRKSLDDQLHRLAEGVLPRRRPRVRTG